MEIARQQGTSILLHQKVRNILFWYGNTAIENQFAELSSLSLSAKLQSKKINFSLLLNIPLK